MDFSWTPPRFKLHFPFMIQGIKKSLKSPVTKRGIANYLIFNWAEKLKVDIMFV